MTGQVRSPVYYAGEISRGADGAAVDGDVCDDVIRAPIRAVLVPPCVL